MGWEIDPSGSDTFTIRRNSRATSRAAFFDALADDRSLRTELTRCLRESPYSAFAWETPALSAATAEHDAIFAVIDSPALVQVVADSSPFAAQLTDPHRVATFHNLGGDAVLIVPSPRAAPDAPHVAAFVRSAADDVIDDLWSAVGRAVGWTRHLVAPEIDGFRRHDSCSNACMASLEANAPDRTHRSRIRQVRRSVRDQLFELTRKRTRDEAARHARDG